LFVIYIFFNFVDVFIASVYQFSSRPDPPREARDSTVLASVKCLAQLLIKENKLLYEGDTADLWITINPAEVKFKNETHQTALFSRQLH
jgi:hypothetical protein